MAGEGVAKGVRVHACGDALALRQLLQCIGQHYRRDAGATRADEHGLGIRAGDVGAYLQPVAHGLQRFFADRHHAHARSLAGYGDFAAFDVEPADIQADQFGAPQAGGIHQFEHGQVAQPPVVIRLGFQQMRHGIDAGGVGQFLFAFRRAQAGAGIGRQPALAGEVVEEAAPGGERAGQRFRLQALAAQDGERAPDVVRGQAFRAGLANPFMQMAQVDGIGRYGGRAVLARGE